MKTQSKASIPADWTELIHSEDLHLQKLHDLITSSMQEEQLLSAKLLEVDDAKKDTFGQKMADKIASFGGSWIFIILFLSSLAGWIVINSAHWSHVDFDPYPFIFLNLILSCIAALQAPVIMMSQNRQEEKDRSRSRSDFMINIKAELEVRSLHQKIDLLIAEQMKSLFELQRAQLEALTRLENMSNQRK